MFLNYYDLTLDGMTTKFVNVMTHLDVLDKPCSSMNHMNVDLDNIEHVLTEAIGVIYVFDLSRGDYLSTSKSLRSQIESFRQIYQQIIKNEVLNKNFLFMTVILPHVPKLFLEDNRFNRLKIEIESISYQKKAGLISNNQIIVSHFEEISPTATDIYNLLPTLMSSRKEAMMERL